jgi:hypothetical protein
VSLLVSLIAASALGLAAAYVTEPTKMQADAARPAALVSAPVGAAFDIRRATESAGTLALAALGSAETYVAEPTTMASDPARPAASVSERVGAAFDIVGPPESAGTSAASEPPPQSAAAIFEQSAASEASEKADGEKHSSPGPTPLPQRPSADGDAGFRNQEGREDSLRSAHRPKPSQAGASGTAIPATAVKTTAANSGAGSNWSIQLAGGKTASEANAAFWQLRKKRESLLADRDAMLLKKRIGADAGHWHYVRIAADSRDAATRLCTRLLAAGETCTVVANEPLKEPAAAKP